jgi:3-oxoadipate enol-lactonase
LSTIVLSGSLGSTCAMWDAQVAVLRERFDVVAIDHPGHGGAPLVGVEDVADLARVALEQSPAERFSFVGLSLGGAVGMRIALDTPERLDKLVLASTSAWFGPPEFWTNRAATVRAHGVQAVADVVLERWFTPAFPDVQRFRQMLLSTDREGYARCCDALARWDARDELDTVAAPTLVVAGAEDPSTPVENMELIAERVTDARLHVIENARHLVNVERAAEFNDVLLGFL